MRWGVAMMLITAVLAAGCGDEEGDGATRPATFSGLTAYGALKGTVKIAVEARGTPVLELLAGGSPVGKLPAPPYSFSWDTTKSPDGLVKLSLREHDGQGPAVVDEVTVVVLNRGSEALYHKEVSSGTLAVPQAGSDNPHVSFTWTMPDDGTKEVLALLFWKDNRFSMELSMGVGCCASSGTTGAKSQGATSPVVTSFVDTKELPLPVSLKWFVDASATNSGDLAGQKTDLSVKVYLLK